MWKPKKQRYKYLKLNLLVSFPGFLECARACLCPISANEKHFFAEETDLTQYPGGTIVDTEFS